VQELRARIRKRKRQGYTDDQIAEELKAAGLPIGTSTLKFYLRSKKRSGLSKTQPSKPTAKVNGEDEALRDRRSSSGQEPRSGSLEKRDR
jgi:transposase